jgi:ribosomal protein S12 methylthiotransferase
MPLQHISDPILKAMRRGVSGARTRRLLDTLRSRIPDLAVRTGFIVGFPGETEQNFEELVDFVGEQRFDNVGVFTFSPQAETPASQFPDQVPEELRQERRERLMLLQQDIHLENNAAWVGRQVDVLIEGIHPETDLLWVGRTAQQAPEIDGRVLINDAGAAQYGDIARLEVTEVAGYDLVGHVVAPASGP